MAGVRRMIRSSTYSRSHRIRGQRFTNQPPTPTHIIRCPSATTNLALCLFICRLCPGRSRKDRPLYRHQLEPSRRVEVPTSSRSHLRCLPEVPTRSGKSEYKLGRTFQAASLQLQSLLLNCEMI